MQVDFIRKCGQAVAAGLLVVVVAMFATGMVSPAAAGADELAAGTVAEAQADGAAQETEGADEASSEEETDPADPAQSEDAVPVYRLHALWSGQHFYTADKAERNALMPLGWHYEGIGWMAPTEGDEVYRLYNPSSGSHTFTIDSAERDSLVKAGWTSEGVAWHSPEAPDEGDVAVLRLYDTASSAGEHLFTTSEAERDALIGSSWQDEGIGWFGAVPDDDFADDAKVWRAEDYEPVFRIYNPFTGEHFYTANKSERNDLAAGGWHYEGVGWMAPVAGDEVYRLYNPNTTDHHYVVSAEERDQLVGLGWRYEGVGWHSCTTDDLARVPVYRQYNPNAPIGAHNLTTSAEENANLVGAGWQGEGVGLYGCVRDSSYIDDMEPWWPRISGDAAFDTELEALLRSHSTLRDCFDYVSSFRYISGNRFWSGPRVLPDDTTIPFAREMMSAHGGNCYRFASLFCWLARGLGYNANVISGWVPSYSGGRAPHGWVEIYQDGRTYVCDPDLNHELRGYNWFMVTYASAPTTYGSW